MPDHIAAPPPAVHQRDLSATALWAWIIAATLVKAALAAVLPLSGDEAYYYDCSRHPDWCYFDQPGLVIWAMIPARAMLGETALAVRAPALLASAAFGWFAARILLRLGGTQRQALQFWGLLHATPLFFIGSAYASTDVVMMAAYAAATWSLMVIADGDRRGFWGLGLALGLGFLGKYTIVLVLPALLPALWRRQAAVQLRTATPWLAGLLCLALTAPVWIWAMQHDWDNIRFQFGRVPEGFRPQQLLQFWAGSLAIVTPTIGIAAVAAWIVSWRRGRTPSWQVLRWAVAAPMVFWSALAARGPVSTHWSAPAMLLALVALVMLDFRGRRLLVKLGIATTAIILPLLLSIPLLPAPWQRLEQWLRTQQGRPDKAELHKLFGYRELADEVARRLRPGELAACQRYSYVHLLSFLSGGQLPTRLYRGTAHGLASLYWHPVEELQGRNVLVFTTDPKLDLELRPLFEAIEEEEPYVAQYEGKVMQHWRFLRCTNLRQPAPGFTRLRRP